MAGLLNLNFKDSFGRVVASISNVGSAIWQGFSTGLTTVINNVPHTQVAASSGTSDEEEAETSDG